MKFCLLVDYKSILLVHQWKAFNVKQQHQEKGRFPSAVVYIDNVLFTGLFRCHRMFHRMLYRMSLIYSRMSLTILFLCVVILNSGGFVRTMVNCYSDLCRVNPDS